MVGRQPIERLPPEAITLEEQFKQKLRLQRRFVQLQPLRARLGVCPQKPRHRILVRDNGRFAFW